MNNLESLSLFIGTGICNANCEHCAGKIHREYAPKEDGIINESLIRKILEDCYDKGARYLSLSSSGEPTLSPQSVSRVLKIVDEYAVVGVKYNPINLYSNGIRIGQDKEFCDSYLPLWKNYGLTTIYVTIHDIDERRNAEIYGIKKYPSLETVVSRIHDAKLLVRANLMLSKNTISTLDKFVSTISYLKNLGVDKISSWPIRGMDDKPDNKLSPDDIELDKITSWIKENKYDNYVRVLREDNQLLYQENKKLTLFPDETLSNKWCN